MNSSTYRLTSFNIPGIIGVLVISVFIFRAVFYSADSFLFMAINDLIIIVTITILVLYLIKIVRQKNPHPLALVLNLGSILAFVFLMNLFGENTLSVLFENVHNRVNNPGLFENLVYTFYCMIFLFASAYWFVSLMEFYFHKQHRGSKMYYVTMLIFILLASVSNLLFANSDNDYIFKTFLIISIILIVINSIRISWIAFITKREKIYLLVLSVIISALFIINLVYVNDDKFHKTVLLNFSPSFYQFFSIVLLYGAVYFGILFFTTLFHIPTAEAYDRKAKEVSSLQYFSKLITQVLDFSELAETITDIATKVSSADVAWIVMKDGSNRNIIANKNIAYVDANLIDRFILESGICNMITETKICSLEKFADKNKLSEKFGSAAISPLRSHNEIKGYLIAARKNELIFYDEDKTAINTFSDYASVALENSLLLEESIEKERLEKELDVAREIQKKILPACDPVFEKLSIASVFIPAFEVGGDYYDFFEISKNKFGFVIADVSGKGISAAFIMAEVKGIFQSLSRMINSPKEILTKANEILNHTLSKKNFVSALYGVIDFDKEILHFARAGHCPAILIRKENAEMFKPSGIGLGLANDMLFKSNLEEIIIELKHDDTLVFYTDGITESKNKSLEDFGEQRFNEILINSAKENVDKIANEVIKNVTIFSSSHSQYDDITLIILKWNKK